jgi:hypothetical protein
VSLEGAIRFGRYAFPPNQLGYCGPADSSALLQYVASGSADGGLLELARRFDGAYPYLCLIARCNGLTDPLDEGVVEAYWLGNRLLSGVDAGSLHSSLRERFARRMTRAEFSWLLPKLEAGARPHHNFHVFDIYLRAGLMRDGRADRALEVMDSCRVSWGTVTALEPGRLLLRRRPLVYAGGRLGLAPAQHVFVTRAEGGLGLVSEVSVGDRVAVHWNWACERLDSGRLRALQVATRRCLLLANQTM